MLIFDATPLIYLSKTGCIEYIVDLDEKKVIPSSVYHEVVVIGKEKGFTDSLKVQKAVEDGIFHIQEVEDDFVHKTMGFGLNITKADMDVLELAHKENSTAIIDDSYARDIADILGIETRGTLYLIIEFLKKSIVSKEKCLQIVNDMIEAGWYCSTDLYTQIIRRLED